MKVVIKDKKSLAKHIIKFYYDNYLEDKDRIISPIKLQKCMYFLFAMWGGYVSASKYQNEDDEHNYPKYLFDAEFSRWTYGPVDVASYNWFKKLDKSKIKELSLLTEKDFTCEDDDGNIINFINEMLNKLFKISDFGLVNLSHSDKVWKQATKDKKSKLNNEKIIKEYEHRIKWSIW